MTWHFQVFQTEPSEADLSFTFLTRSNFEIFFFSLIFQFFFSLSFSLSRSSFKFNFKIGSCIFVLSYLLYLPPTPLLAFCFLEPQPTWLIWWCSVKVQLLLFLIVLSCSTFLFFLHNILSKVKDNLLFQYWYKIGRASCRERV